MTIPILMYHQIDEPPPRGTPLRGLVVSPGAFARQMRLIKLLGYRGLSMRDLEPYLKGERQGKVVGITFDDGYQNNLHNALPVLLKHGFTATVYAVSDMIGGTNSWDHGMVEEKPLMSHADWQAWLAAGMDIGSHTRTHADLNQLDATQARDQITGSRQELEKALGCVVRHFCYPYGLFRPEHAQMAAQAGYATATTTRRGRVQEGDDPMQLRRVLVAQATSLPQLALKLLTTYEDRRG
ncbi:polysaccharide deacetylase family protein [Rhodoferax sp. BAB1]|uniref:polysaccharide deacetylase family protein n=1 Tax=Rhodoferax sp. BAB1 TaxID=2741720 RepID=UPI0015751726|nr:polysaccharide deacetylase family protein [Rhodoferax sp. BAB1]QKO21893.1 polysaccharide deacetylase family protein [Rhodoferax sp. BAB1]